MLCDRLAVLVGGKLQGVGSPESIVTIEVKGMEILAEVPEGRTLPADLAAAAMRTGNRYRIQVPAGELYGAMEMLKGAGAAVLSVTQIKPTLEDYFFELVGREKPRAFAVELSEEPKA